ncbi:MAG: hypothetical protein K0S65_3049 [Labilithrix sp.]|nr:hypothetical protein [Labilithrix sp.]
MPGLREAGGTEIERRLLASAAEDVMPAAKHRALVEWSARAASTAVRTTSAGPAWKPALVKGLGLAALAAASLVVFDHLSVPSGASRGGGSAPREIASQAALATSAETHGAVPATLPGASPEVGATVTPDQLPSAPVAVPARPAPKKAAANDVSLGEQMKFIDSARTRLRQDDPRGALSVLDEYARKYPEASFREEATVLRVSALAKAGNVAEARKLGSAFLNTHPAELYSQRVEAIVRSLDSEESGR